MKKLVVASCLLQKKSSCFFSTPLWAHFWFGFRHADLFREVKFACTYMAALSGRLVNDRTGALGAQPLLSCVSMNAVGSSSYTYLWFVLAARQLLHSSIVHKYREVE